MKHKLKLSKCLEVLGNFILTNYFTERGYLNEYTTNNSSRKIGECNIISISAALALLFFLQVDDKNFKTKPALRQHTS